jgi:hypothetical protein
MTGSSITTRILVDTESFIDAADPRDGDEDSLAFGVIQDLIGRDQFIVGAQIAGSGALPVGDVAGPIRFASIRFDPLRPT